MPGILPEQQAEDDSGWFATPTGGDWVYQSPSRRRSFGSMNDDYADRSSYGQFLGCLALLLMGLSLRSTLLDDC